MTLSKQLLILISTFFLMICGVNIAISVNKIRGFLLIETQRHAQDAANLFSFSLNPEIANEYDPKLQTLMKALFATGLYTELNLVNVSNKPLLTLTKNEDFDAPVWITKLLPLGTAAAECEIYSGQSLVGVIYVTVNPERAYRMLYRQTISAFGYSFALFILLMISLNLVLRLTLLPLKTINQLALTLADGEFKTIEKLPRTIEVRNLTHAVNAMSGRLGDIFSNLKARIESLDKKLQLDQLTGLPKKTRFDNDIKKLLMENTEAYLFLIKIDCLSALIKEQTSEAIDVFLHDCAFSIKQTIDEFVTIEATPYRLFGGEFAVLVRKINFQQADRFANLLSSTFTELGERYQKQDIAHIGGTPINLLTSTSRLLAAANEALEQSKLIGPNGYYMREDDNQAKDIAEWKTLVFDIIDKDSYELAMIGQIETFDEKKLIMEEAFIRVFDATGNSLPIGIFISIAEKYEKIIDLDKGVLEKVFQHIERHQIEHAIAVNISTRTVKNNDFRTWLTTQLQNRKSITSQIVFSFSAYAVAKEFNIYREFIGCVHGFGAKVIIKRFDTFCLSIDRIKILKPDFIRLSRDLSNGICSEPGKYSFVETLKEVGDLLDFAVFAENIVSDKDYSEFKTIDIAGASR
ncbi:MAG: EAL domain-containing protein [Gammaproteobacteria bacterium]